MTEQCCGTCHYYQPFADVSPTYGFCKWPNCDVIPQWMEPWTWPMDAKDDGRDCKVWQADEDTPS